MNVHLDYSLLFHRFVHRCERGSNIDETAEPNKSIDGASLGDDGGDGWSGA